MIPLSVIAFILVGIPILGGVLIYFIARPHYRNETIVYPPGLDPQDPRYLALQEQERRRNLARLAVGGAIVVGLHEAGKKMDERNVRLNAERVAREQANQPKPFPPNPYGG
jgi:hypothetical protein